MSWQLTTLMNTAWLTDHNLFKKNIENWQCVIILWNWQYTVRVWQYTSNRLTIYWIVSDKLLVIWFDKILKNFSDSVLPAIAFSCQIWQYTDSILEPTDSDQSIVSVFPVCCQMSSVLSGFRITPNRQLPAQFSCHDLDFFKDGHLTTVITPLRLK